jgi:hypothetical protein
MTSKKKLLQQEKKELYTTVACWDVYCTDMIEFGSSPYKDNESPMTYPEAEEYISKSDHQLSKYEIIRSKNTDVSSLSKIAIDKIEDILTSDHGIYFWCDKVTNEVVYIGIATGRGGLQHRILEQHLNPSYIEYRADKHSEKKDKYQLKNPFVENLTNGRVRKGIDKSSFRKSIGRKISINPGEDTVKYIKENFYLKVLTSADDDYIKELEKIMVGHLKPKFNIQFNKE